MPSPAMSRKMLFDGMAEIEKRNRERLGEGTGGQLNPLDEEVYDMSQESSDSGNNGTQSQVRFSESVKSPHHLTGKERDEHIFNRLQRLHEMEVRGEMENEREMMGKRNSKKIHFPGPIVIPFNDDEIASPVGTPVDTEPGFPLEEVDPLKLKVENDCVPNNHASIEEGNSGSGGIRTTTLTLPTGPPNGPTITLSATPRTPPQTSSPASSSPKSSPRTARSIGGSRGAIIPTSISLAEPLSPGALPSPGAPPSIMIPFTPVRPRPTLSPLTSGSPQSSNSNSGTAPPEICDHTGPSATTGSAVQSVSSPENSPGYDIPQSAISNSTDGSAPSSNATAVAPNSTAPIFLVSPPPDTDHRTQSAAKQAYIANDNGKPHQKYANNHYLGAISQVPLPPHSSVLEKSQYIWALVHETTFSQTFTEIAHELEKMIAYSKYVLGEEEIWSDKIGGSYDQMF